MSALHPAAVEFIERLALIAESEGLPRIAGRIVGLLVMRQEPVSFDDLADQLQVSRASVSTNTRLLESRGILRRVSRLGERKDLFELGPVERIFEQELERQRAAHRIATDTRRRLPAACAKVKEALKRMEEFSSLRIESMERALSAWKKRNR